MCIILFKLVAENFTIKLRIILPDGNMRKLACDVNTVVDMTSALESKFSLPESFMLQYLDEEFSNYFTLDDDVEIKDLMSIKVVSTVAVVDESTPICSSSSQADANSDISEINPGYRTRSIVHDYSLQKFDADVEFLLQKANNTFAESEKLSFVGHGIRSRMLTHICADIYENFTAYPSSAKL